MRATLTITLTTAILGVVMLIALTTPSQGVFI